MMLRLALALIFSTVFYFGCASEPKKEFDRTSWQGRMHRLALKFSDMVSLSSDELKFSARKNEPLIMKQMGEFKDLFQSLHAEGSFPDKDPILKYAANKTVEDLHLAQTRFAIGDKYSARSIVSRISNNCFTCHSRNDRGRENLGFDWGVNKKKMKSSEEAHYYFAIRDYSKALRLVKEHFSKKNKNYSKRWEEALFMGLAVAVRVNQSPKEGLDLVQSIKSRSSLPRYLRVAISQWERSLISWSKEKSVEERSPGQKYNLAKKLYLKNSRKQSPLPALVDFLRASRALHDVVSGSPNFKSYDVSLFYSGILAQKLKSIDGSRIDQAYFERCIDHSPYTFIATRCYAELEKSMRGPAYYKSNGELKEEVRQKLEKLESLATPKLKNQYKDPNNQLWDYTDFFLGI